ncbi:VOC family protein [Leucobacter allii]|uniref:VOC family protein n=1 Tax=Leucobacter allii TaxID=2932247 RepID=A0ABY4FGD5_9MICO|nr:VOC family protein [Leucobacter allii]UOQ55747.1 VOC family protein [Leucobacter allii]UOR00262.1 VOC family protein [Leucobacter allii]
MTTIGCYPVLMSGDVGAAAAFYRELLGFETTFASDWYVSLRLGSCELAILAHDHPTIPEGYGALPRGVLINLEVDDVDALHARLSAREDLPVLQQLRDEEFGQRHFIVGAPDGVLLDVIQPIPPGEAYAEAYR